MVPLGSQCPEEARRITELGFSALAAGRGALRCVSPGLDFYLSDHGKQQSPELALACFRARNIRCVAAYLFGEVTDAHTLQVIGRVASRLRVIFDVPLFCRQKFQALYEVHPPVHECCVASAHTSLWNAGRAGPM